MGIDALPLWYDLADAACLGVLITLPLAGVWIYLDRRTRLANLVRTLWRQPGPRALLFAAVSLSVLFTTAEAVLDHQEDELLTDVDVVVRDAALAAGAWSLPQFLQASEARRGRHSGARLKRSAT